MTRKRGEGGGFNCVLLGRRRRAAAAAAARTPHAPQPPGHGPVLPARLITPPLF